MPQKNRLHKNMRDGLAKCYEKNQYATMQMQFGVQMAMQTSSTAATAAAAAASASAAAIASANQTNMMMSPMMMNPMTMNPMMMNPMMQRFMGLPPSPSNSDSSEESSVLQPPPKRQDVWSEPLAAAAPSAKATLSWSADDEYVAETRPKSAMPLNTPATAMLPAKAMPRTPPPPTPKPPPPTPTSRPSSATPNCPRAPSRASHSIATTAATPITTPSRVNAVRNRFARNDRNAVLMDSVS